VKAKKLNPTLHELQRWVQDVTSHPGGVQKGVKAASGAKTALKGRALNQVIGRSKNLSAAERIGVYAGMYFGRLVDCLRNDYPVLLKTLGEDAFEDLAREFLIKYPSRSFTLNKLGAKMPAYILKTIPVKQHRAFLFDVAQVERAIEEVFDALEEKALNMDSLLSIKPEKWLSMTLQVSQALRLFACKFPVNDFIEAAKSGDAPEIPKRGKSWLAVYRNDYSVWRLNIEQWQFELLHALQQGETLGNAVEQAIQVMPETNEQSIASVQRWFELAAKRGWFVGAKI